MAVLEIRDRGRESFANTLQVQLELVNALAAREADYLSSISSGAGGHYDGTDSLILVEHDPIYTTGRSGAPQLITDDLGKTVPWVGTGRGGQATYHGPGQLVAYPIINLREYARRKRHLDFNQCDSLANDKPEIEDVCRVELDIHEYLRLLEEVVIAALGLLGFPAFQRPGLTGVWVHCRELDCEEITWKKIASIGIKVQKWIAYYGLSLNVDNDLRYFRAISPCGGKGTDITSLSELCAREGVTVPTMFAVKEAIVAAFEKIFKYSEESRIGRNRVVDDHEVRRESVSSHGVAHRLVSLKRPEWLRVKASESPQFGETRRIVREQGLVTVCEEAGCPNMGECWANGTATFMIMGDLCTRRCGFCSVKDGTLETLEGLNIFEPLQVAQAVNRLGLKYVVVTSVNRDDLPDMGAEHFKRTVLAIKKTSPECKVELLIPDMRGQRELVEIILSSNGVSVLNHNVETVPRLYKKVRPGAQLDRSLNVLRAAKLYCGSNTVAKSGCHTEGIKTKSGLMVGLGEKEKEVLALMDLLRDADVDILTIGQYLQPTAKQLPIVEYVKPEQFGFYAEAARERGFYYVESGPLVRSSYHAWKHVSSNGLGIHRKADSTQIGLGMS